jgi:hypothetical protein
MFVFLSTKCFCVNGLDALNSSALRGSIGLWWQIAVHLRIEERAKNAGS